MEIVSNVNLKMAMCNKSKSCNFNSSLPTSKMGTNIDKKNNTIKDINEKF